MKEGRISEVVYENLYLHFFNREIYRGVLGEKTEELKMNHTDLLTTIMFCGLNPLLASFSAFAETIDILDEKGKVYRELHNAGYITVCGETLNIDLNIARKQAIYKFDATRYRGYFGCEAKSLEKIVPTVLKTDVTFRIEEAFMEESWQQVFNVTPTNFDKQIMQDNQKTIREIIKNRDDNAITKSLISNEKYGTVLPISVGRTLSGFYVFDYRDFGESDIVSGIQHLTEYDFLCKHFPHHDYPILREMLVLLGFSNKFGWKEFEAGIKYHKTLEHQEFSFAFHELLFDLYKRFLKKFKNKKTIDQKRISFLPFIRKEIAKGKVKKIDFEAGNIFIQALENINKVYMNKNNESRRTIVMNNKKVFVVTGRNEKLRLSIFNLLRALRLEPMEWMEVIKSTGQASPYLNQAIITSIEEAGAVVIIMAPEEQAKLVKELQSEEGDDKTYKQPRPNVIFEAGLALGMKESKTIILQFGESRVFSDILGKHITKYQGKEKENDFKVNFLQKLEIAGCHCEVGNDYFNIEIDYV